MDFEYHAALSALASIKAAGLSAGVKCVEEESIHELLSRLRHCREWIKSRAPLILSLHAEARCLLSLSNSSWKPEQLEASLQMAQSAQALCDTTEHPQLRTILLDIFSIHAFRFRLTNDTVDMDAAIDTSQQLKLISQDNPYLASVAQQNWSLMYFHRAVLRKNLDEMDSGISGMKHALMMSPPQNYRKKLHMAAELTASMGVYFHHNGQISLLDEIIQLSLDEPALADNSDFVTCNVVEAILIRAQIGDSSTSGELLRRAVELIQSRLGHSTYKQGAQERGLLHFRLVEACRLQLQRGDSPSLSEDAMLKLARESRKAISDDSVIVSSELAATTTGLCAILAEQAREHRDESFLDEAADILVRTLSLKSVAESVFSSDYVAAQADIIGRARERFRISLRWGRHAEEQDYPQVALTAYSHAIALLPHVIFLGHDVIGRLEALRQVTGLAANSAALALSLQDIPKAFDFLEKSRGVLWSQALQVRASTGMLPTELRDRYATIAADLNNDEHLDSTTRRHRALELETIISEIRQVAGLKDFLRPPQLEEVVTLLQARHSFAVMIIPHATCCHAIVLGVRRNGYCHVKLGALDATAIQQLSREFAHVCDQSRSACGQEVTTRKVRMVWEQPSRTKAETVLAKLWTDIVYPVLLALDMQASQLRHERS
jgi:hypothetical protein